MDNAGLKRFDTQTSINLQQLQHFSAIGRYRNPQDIQLHEAMVKSIPRKNTTSDSYTMLLAPPIGIFFGSSMKAMRSTILAYFEEQCVECG
jgi:hypothetical protein